MKDNFTPKSRKENLVIQELEGEVLIYDLEKNKAFCLNETSALVWQSCDGNRTIAEITDTVGKQLNSQVNEDIVWLALDQLSKESLVEKEVESQSKFRGLSRREVIKQVGLGTMVALPLIAAITAPAATTAGTCLQNDQSCTQSNQCCSNCCKNVSPSINQCKPGGGACLP